MRALGRIGDFLLFCAGVSPRLMAKCPDSERPKHTMIGALMLITASTAAIAMYYAGICVFENAPTALALGLGYGSFVFCLDRFMIATIRKRSRAVLLGQALVRMGVAILVALVIATPLDLRVLRDRLARAREELRLRAMEKDRVFLERVTGFTDATAKLATQNTTLDDLTRRLGEDPPGETFKTTVRSAETCRTSLGRFVDRRRRDEPPLLRRLDEIDNEISSPHRDSLSSNQLTTLEIERRDIARRVSSLRSAVNSKSQECNQLETSINRQRYEHTETLRRRHEQINGDITRLLNIQQSATVTTKKELQRSGAASDQAFHSNLIADLEAMWMLMQENNTIWWICMGLTLFLISIDTAPIASKLIAPRGPYDAALEAEETVAMAPHEATIRFHAQADHSVFMEPLKLQHACLAIERGLTAYMEVAVSFSRRMQELTTEFQTKLQQFEHMARKSTDPADAHLIAKLIRETNDMFSKARAEAMAEFSTRMRQAFD